MADNFNKQGGYFSPPGYFKVETGGSHEENPNGGVQIGMDKQGIPNMLEEGEPVYKDYVYSDNIKAEAKFLKQNHLPEKFAGKLYSEIADAFVDEAEDRPLDAISNNGLNVMLVRLADAQDQQKLQREQEDLEKELEKLSPEDLEMLAQELEAEQPQSQQVPVSMPEQEPVNPSQPIMQPQIMRNGGVLTQFGNGSPGTVTSIPRFEAPDTGAISQSMDMRGPLRRALDEVIDSSSKLRSIRRGVERFSESAPGKALGLALPVMADGAIGTAAPGMSREKIVGDAMEKAYKMLEAEKTTGIAKHSTGDLIKTGFKYLVDPLRDWQPTKWYTKAAKGLSTQAIIAAEATGTTWGGISLWNNQIRTRTGTNSEAAYEAARAIDHPFKANGGPLTSKQRPIRKFESGTPGELSTPSDELAWRLLRQRLHKEQAAEALLYGSEGKFDEYKRIYNTNKQLSDFLRGINGDETRDLGELADRISIPQKTVYPLLQEEDKLSKISGDDLLLRKMKAAEVPAYNAVYQMDKWQSTPEELAANDGSNFSILTASRNIDIPGSSIEDIDVDVADNMTPEERIAWANEYLSEQGKTNEGTSAISNLSTFPRYAGALSAAASGLYNLFQKPDKYKFKALTPALPSGRLNLLNPAYKPIDQNLAVNDLLSSSAGTQRILRNTGLGPSTAAALLSSDYNVGRNLGSARAQTFYLNNEARNNAIASRNSNATAIANFNNELNAARANAINAASIQNIQNEQAIRTANYQAENQKYAALQSQLNALSKALSGIGSENLAYNMANNTPGWDYAQLPGGVTVKKRNGGLLKKYK